MRGAGQVPKLDYDETEDAQSMSVFEKGDGKGWFERRLADQLVSAVDDAWQRTRLYLHEVHCGTWIYLRVIGCAP